VGNAFDLVIDRHHNGDLGAIDGVLGREGGRCDRSDDHGGRLVYCGASVAKFGDRAVGLGLRVMDRSTWCLDGVPVAIIGWRSDTAAIYVFEADSGA
jgi:hypothetical protein